MFTRWQSVTAAVAVVAAVLVPASASLAQDSPVPGCSGDVVGLWPNAGFGNNATASIYATRFGRPSERTIASAVPAGTYQVTAVSYDGYQGRSTTLPEQFLEQYVLEFLDGGGAVLAATGATADLADGVEEAFWSGSVGSVTLGEDAVAVRARHLYAGQSVGTQSVMPSCFGASEVITTTTTTTTTSTTTTTTTTPSTSTPTTEPPATTSIPGATTTTTAAPATTTSTTAPTVVLPVVQQTPDPNPVVGTPNFTG